MVAEDYLSQLNAQQREAVEYLGGPELVIAGAGSGKTRVLTYKIVHLLANGHSPNRILALTFTNKAAREMRERICALVGEETASRLWMGTFHSIFSRFLRMNAERIGFTSNFTIYDSSDSKSLIKSIIRELHLDDKMYRPGQVAAAISFAKNQLYSPEDYAADRALVRSDADAGRGRIHEIFKIYRDRCRIAGAMDFDDLLYYTNVLFRDNPDVLEHFSNYFSYVLVDEYQDTNFAQHLIVRQLCGARKQLCVVGDDAQSIYSFRGANIRNILDFKKTFPEQRTFKLEENYRSSRNIIGAANSLISANHEQIPKNVFSNKADGELIELVQSYNEYEEAYAVAARIAQVRMRYKSPLSEIAVLYRTNAQSRVLEEALRNRNLAYRIFGGLAFYQRKEVKDAVSYFRLAVNPDDDEALRRIINTPKRGIGETTVAKLLSAAVSTGTSIYRVLLNPEASGVNVNKGTLAKLKGFTDLISSFVRKAQVNNASDLAKKIYEGTGILKEYMSENTPETISKRDNLLELLNAVDNFSKMAVEQGSERTGMADFLAEVSLLTDQDTAEAGDDSITLMTIHSAKGLEFDCVFVVGAEEDLFPSGMCRTNAEIEEERRLMYVAITRARRFCMISYAARRTVNGQPTNRLPSRFIADIDRRFIRSIAGAARADAPRPRSASRPQEPVAPQQRRVVVQEASKSAPVPKAKVPGCDNHTAAELSEGMRIFHPVFQEGVIKAIDTDSPDHRIVVRFDSDGEVRKLLLKFAKFKIL